MTVNVYYNTSEKHDVITSFSSATGADSLNAIPNYVWLDSALMMYVDSRMISLIGGVSLSNEKINIMIKPLYSEYQRYDIVYHNIYLFIRLFIATAVHINSSTDITLQGYSALISGNKITILQNNYGSFRVLQTMIICFATLVHY